MKVRSLLLICFFNLLSAGLFAQTLFPEVMDVCSPEKFCLECGTPKATCDSFTLGGISDRINYKYNFRNGTGTMTFQVLVDSTGFSCVLSHTDATHSQLATDLIIALNTARWRPARIGSKRITSSVNVLFTIANGKITGQMKRRDPAELIPIGNATVYNTQYKYSNPTLKTYDFTTWTKYNAPFEDNPAKICVVDKADKVWYAPLRGLDLFDGKSFIAINETNSPFKTGVNIHALALGKDDKKWIYASNGIFTFDNNQWQIFDTVRFGVKHATKVIANPSGEIFFTGDNGLLIVRDDKFRLINKETIIEMPSNKVNYAYYDTKERLWIGTLNGTIMINKQQKVTMFSLGHTPLSNTYMNDMAEDEQGNLYFALHGIKGEVTDANADDEGIAVYSADGKWYHYNDKNSGMPANHVNNLLYDKFEHVLWLGTQEAGLVRFDLKGSWENYNNNNSAVPSYNVYQLSQDSKGIIYAATSNGMLRMMKK